MLAIFERRTVSALCACDYYIDRIWRLECPEDFHWGWATYSTTLWNRHKAKPPTQYLYIYIILKLLPGGVMAHPTVTKIYAILVYIYQSIYLSIHPSRASVVYWFNPLSPTYMSPVRLSSAMVQAFLWEWGVRCTNNNRITNSWCGNVEKMIPLKAFRVWTQFVNTIRRYEKSVDERRECWTRRADEKNHRQALEWPLTLSPWTVTVHYTTALRDKTMNVKYNTHYEYLCIRRLLFWMSSGRS